MSRFLVVLAIALYSGTALATSVTSVTLDLQTNAYGQWFVYAKVDDPTNVSAGLASFMLQMVATDDATITSAVMAAPVGEIDGTPVAGFISHVAAYQRAAKYNDPTWYITGGQDTLVNPHYVISDPKILNVLSGVGLTPQTYSSAWFPVTTPLPDASGPTPVLTGLDNPVTWLADGSVMLAKGTYTGTGTIAVVGFGNLLKNDGDGMWMGPTLNPQTNRTTLNVFTTTWIGDSLTAPIPQDMPVVPEPLTLTAVALAFGGIGTYIRRRRAA